MIVFDCPSCRAKLQVPDEHAGKLMRCPSCQATAPIPSGATEASAVSAQPIAPPVALPAPVPDTSGRKRDDRADDRDERDEDRPRRRRRRDRDDRAPPKKSGGMGVVLTLVIVGIGVCFIGLIMAALLIPAVQKVREAAARTQSTNNLKQIALGFHSFHDTNKRLPFNGSEANPFGGGVALYSKNAVPGSSTSGSWGFQILPYIEQQRLFNQIDRNSPVPTYLCPARGRPSVEAGAGAWTDYFYNNYINDNGNDPSKPDNADVKRTLVGITDGTSNTVLLGHGNISTNMYAHFAGVPFSSNIYLGGTTGTMRAGGNAVFGAPPVGVSLQRDSLGQPGVGGWGGPLPAGGLMVMCDGAVHTFPYQTANFGEFLTPNGGELVILPR